ncbi:ABC transporter substrate-binding protein [Streptomyces prasinus]|uniref:ABC transporter substrate-binding protein n=1 Tax=Streptomyces prasinus TaxID=67345 RepID=UPI003680F988
MSRSRSSLRSATLALAAVPLVMALTACGGPDSANSGDSKEKTAAEGTGRAVQTAFGEVKIDGTPKKIVTLSDVSLDTALSLGITPVGTSAARGAEGAPAYLSDRAAGIPLVATVREPNTEAILKAEPDLILTGPNLEKSQYETLSAIAPTIVPAAGDWRSGLDTYGEALGKTDELDKKIDALVERAGEAGDGAKGTGVVMRWMPGGPIVMNSANMPTAMLEEAGLSPLPIAEDLGKQPHSDPLSLENLTKADADHVFIATLNAEGDEALEAARSEKAFTRMKAVEAGRDHGVDGQVWSSSNGPIAMEKVITDIEKALGK